MDGILVVELIGGEDVGIGGVLTDSKRFLSPDCRIDNLSQSFNVLSCLLNHRVGHILESSQVLHIHGTADEPGVVLDHVGSCVPEGVEVAGRAVGDYYLFEVASQISFGVGGVEESD